jgi:hypothetical protein
MNQTKLKLPHASAIANRAVTELIVRGEAKLARELAAIHRAYLDLVDAQHAEKDAPTGSLQAAARQKMHHALELLRGGAKA